MQVFVEPVSGREPLHHPGIGAGHAEQAQIGQVGEQHLQRHRQEVKHEVEGGHGKGVACQEGAHRGAGKVEQGQPQRTEHRHRQAHGVQQAESRRHDDAQRPAHYKGDQHHQKAGEEIGDKEPLAADGQGVHQPHAAGIEQVAPNRHGAHHRVYQQHRRNQIGKHGVIALCDVQGIHAGRSPVAHQLHRHHDGRQGRQEGGHDPQGPEPGEILAQQGFIKAPGP